MKFFRGHVEGDFVDQFELNTVNEICKENPNLCYMTYTKKYVMCNKWLKANHKADNFILIYSAWDGLKMNNPYDLPVCLVAPDVATYKGLIKKYGSKARVCGHLALKPDGTYIFDKGNCKVCAENHTKGNCKGGCFDLTKGMVVIMLAH